MFRSCTWLALASIFLLFTNCTSEKTTSSDITYSISNSKPRMDKDSAIVDAHDGRIIQFEGKFYWYGTSYGETNGFTTANKYLCYSSKDLINWEKQGALIPNQPEGVYYRPHVIYNKKTKKYVLWYNWYPKLWNGKFGVAVSDTPQGPFKIINDDVQMSRSEAGLGDFGLFVDDDGTAYISYNTINNHQVSIEKLDDSYTGSTMENGGIIAQHMEAGSQFKHNNKYYLLTDYTCCFCNYGSGARVYVSNDPLTGYTFTGNINRYPGKKALMLSDSVSRGTQYETLEKRPSGYDGIELQLEKHSSVNEIEISLFTGNRPENCGNVENPRVHPEINIPEFDFFTWQFDGWKPLKADLLTRESSALNESMRFTVNIEADRIKVVPKDSSATTALYINEITLFNNQQKLPFNGYISHKSIPQKPIIPAQQTYVMKLNTNAGEKFIWMGDLWGSASDNIKGHDYQYWSAPLNFKEDGTIYPLQWTDSWDYQPNK